MTRAKRPPRQVRASRQAVQSAQSLSPPAGSRTATKRPRKPRVPLRWSLVSTTLLLIAAFLAGGGLIWAGSWLANDPIDTTIPNPTAVSLDPIYPSAYADAIGSVVKVSIRSQNEAIESMPPLRNNPYVMRVEANFILPPNSRGLDWKFEASRESESRFVDSNCFAKGYPGRECPFGGWESHAPNEPFSIPVFVGTAEDKTWGVRVELVFEVRFLSLGSSHIQRGNQRLLENYIAWRPSKLTGALQGPNDLLDEKGRLVWTDSYDKLKARASQGSWVYLRLGRAPDDTAGCGSSSPDGSYSCMVPTDKEHHISWTEPDYPWQWQIPAAPIVMASSGAISLLAISAILRRHHKTLAERMRQARVELANPNRRNRVFGGAGGFLITVLALVFLMVILARPTGLSAITACCTAGLLLATQAFLANDHRRGGSRLREMTLVTVCGFVVIPALVNLALARVIPAATGMPLIFCVAWGSALMLAWGVLERALTASKRLEVRVEVAVGLFMLGGMGFMFSLLDDASVPTRVSISSVTKTCSGAKRPTSEGSALTASFDGGREETSPMKDGKVIFSAPAYWQEMDFTLYSPDFQNSPPPRSTLVFQAGPRYLEIMSRLLTLGQVKTEDKSVMNIETSATCP